MCEIIFRVKDDMPETGDPFLDARRKRRGDVDAVVPDGHSWGECELGLDTYKHLVARVTKRVERYRVAPDFRPKKLASVHDLPREVLATREIEFEDVVPHEGAFHGPQQPEMHLDGFVRIATFEHKVVREERRPSARHINGNHPFWRILKLPNVSFEAAEGLTAPERQSDDAQVPEDLQRRGWYLDLDSFPAEMQPFLADDARKEPFLVSDMSEADFLKLVKQRTPIISAHTG